MRMRCIEFSLTCDPVLHNLSRFWDLHLGEQRCIIQNRIRELGHEGDDGLVDYLLEVLSGTAARSGERDGIDRRVERNVIETYADRNCTSELRCECCGYHFRAEDISPRKRAIAVDAGLSLSNFIEPRRLEDDLKPISREGKDRLFLRLELDHVIPRLGLGSSTTQNIRLLCSFCNSGKSHYRYPGEAIAESISASASYAFGTTDSATWIARTAVTAILMNQRKSEVSDHTYRSSELTVRFRGGTLGQWLVPWNLEVVAYVDF